MGNVVTTTGGAATAASEGLRGALLTAQFSPDAFTVGMRRLPPAVISEARAALSVMDAAAPADAKRIRSWLAAVAKSVRNPASADDVDGLALAVSLACSDLPAEGFGRAALIRALRTWKFWPSAADVREVVLAELSDWIERKAALRTVAKARQAELPRAIGPADRVAAAEILKRGIA